MTEEELEAEIEREPFVPFRLRLVSGKTVDVLAANAGHTLHDSVLVLKNPTIGKSRADGYDVLAYRNIERIERLEIGKRPTEGPAEAGVAMARLETNHDGVDGSRQVNELGYRPAEADRVARAGKHFAGALALTVAVFSWSWVALDWAPLLPLRSRLTGWLVELAPAWMILGSFGAVVLGIVATRDGRPPGDSRRGNLALILAALLWLTLLASLAGRR